MDWYGVRPEFLTILKINYITGAQRDLMEVMGGPEGNIVSYTETIRIGLINQFAMLKVFTLWQSQ